ncbi:MAG: DUF86 domain-containing protein [Patescibacteria group bacterium]|nr:DUF86 domain-containing protein [Patescibacteria group bacterium]
MLDHNLLNRKMLLLKGYIADIEPLVVKISPDFKMSKDDMQLTERRFQLVVDTMSDINIHLIKEGNLGDPDDIQSTFKILGSVGVLEKEFADKIAPIVGVRNMIVHQYEKLDSEMFLRNLKHNADDFKKYFVQVGEYIKNH